MSDDPRAAIGRGSEALIVADAGLSYTVWVHRFGVGVGGARPKIYLQGALHADETPAALVLLHLVQRLREMEAGGRIVGEIVVVPVANPLGQPQWLQGRHLGRFHGATSVNFNRRFPLLGEAVEARIGEQLGEDASANRRRVRAALVEAARALAPATVDARLKQALLAEAIDADVAVDCHAADDALLHAFVWHGAPDRVVDAVAALGPALIIVNRDSGGASFEDACAQPWAWLAERFPDRPIAAGCQPICIEYRGETAVADALACEDAERLLALLTRFGAIDGDVDGDITRPPIIPVEGFVNIVAPSSGIVTFARPLGSWLDPGEIVAYLRDGGGATVEPAPITTPVSGILFDRALHRMVTAGGFVAAVGSPEPVPGNGCPFDD